MCTPRITPPIWILLLITTLTRAAAFAIQWPVTKSGSTVCLVEETVKFSPGGQQLLANEQLARTWDVWLMSGQCRTRPTYNWGALQNKGKGRHDDVKDKLQSVPQRTTATVVSVQWMVFKSNAGYFDAEDPVGSASYGRRTKGTLCRYWETWLNKDSTRPGWTKNNSCYGPTSPPHHPTHPVTHQTIQ